MPGSGSSSATQRRHSSAGSAGCATVNYVRRGRGRCNPGANQRCLAMCRFPPQAFGTFDRAATGSRTTWRNRLLISRRLSQGSPGIRRCVRTTHAQHRTGSRPANYSAAEALNSSSAPRGTRELSEPSTVVDHHQSGVYPPGGQSLARGRVLGSVAKLGIRDRIRLP